MQFGILYNCSKGDSDEQEGAFVKEGPGAAFHPKMRPWRTDQEDPDPINETIIKGKRGSNTGLKNIP